MANPYYICAYGHVMRVSKRVPADRTAEHNASMDTFGIGMGGSERTRVTVIRCDGKGWSYLTNERKEELRRQLAIKHKRLTGEVMSGYEKFVKEVSGPKEVSEGQRIGQLTAEPFTLDNVTLWGITDGVHWFFYAYETREAAEEFIACLTTPVQREVNICNPQPFLKSNATASEIRENRLNTR